MGVFSDLVTNFKVSVEAVSMAQTVAQQWTRRFGWGGRGGDRVAELPGCGAEQPTTRHSDEVFLGVTRSPFVSLYGLITACTNLMFNGQKYQPYLVCFASTY